MVGVKPVDLEYIKRLSPLTNVIPIIAKADTLEAAEIKSLKVSIISELQSADVRPFLFGMTFDDLQRGVEPCAPFAISSAVASDAENMDASLLMSPDYIQPLVSTELAALVDRVFERDSIAWLRHTAAKKFIHWRNRPASSSTTTHSLSIQSSTYTQGSTSPPPSFFNSSSSPSSSHVLVPPMGATSSYALARVTDHTHHEERMAQVRLAKWASDLQRSLQNERERFEALARGERAVWLTERLGECVADGTLVPISSYTGNNVILSKQGSNNSRYISAAAPPGTNLTARTGLNPRDPLGLIEWNEKIKKRGWLVIRVLGGCSVVGGLAVWAAKSWGYDGLVNWYWGWWGSVD
jgi:Septin